MSAKRITIGTSFLSQGPSPKEQLEAMQRRVRERAKAREDAERKRRGARLAESRKYIMGGFVLPLKRECDTVGASGKVSVKDAKGRIIKKFNSVQMANQFVEKYQ